VKSTTPVRLPLYHYTCSHAYKMLGKRGHLFPASALIGETQTVPWSGHYIWLTDLSHPNVGALGLTSIMLTCDRTAHRYRVADDYEGAHPWTTVRRRLPPGWVADLETPGTLLRHWWVATEPVPVTYDPR
jgi:hypothetical protein